MINLEVILEILIFACSSTYYILNYLFYKSICIIFVDCITGRKTWTISKI